MLFALEIKLDGLSYRKQRETTVFEEFEALGGRLSRSVDRVHFDAVTAALSATHNEALMVTYHDDVTCKSQFLHSGQLCYQNLFTGVVSPCRSNKGGLSIQSIVPRPATELKPTFILHWNVNAPNPPAVEILLAQSLWWDLIPNTPTICTDFDTVRPATTTAIGPASQCDRAIMYDLFLIQRRHNSRADWHILYAEAILCFTVSRSPVRVR